MRRGARRHRADVDEWEQQLPAHVGRVDALVVHRRLGPGLQCGRERAQLVGMLAELNHMGGWWHVVVRQAPGGPALNAGRTGGKGAAAVSALTAVAARADAEKGDGNGASGSEHGTAKAAHDTNGGSAETVRQWVGLGPLALVTDDQPLPKKIGETDAFKDGLGVDPRRVRHRAEG